MSGPVLVAIAVLLALLLALAAVPLTVTFAVDRMDQTRGEIRFRWLFGLVRFHSRIPGDSAPKRERKKRPARKKKRKKAAGRARGLFSLLRMPAFRRRAVRFIRDLLAALHGRDIYLRLRIGLGDPADTGRLWAFLGPLAGFAASLNAAEVRMEPEFLDAVLEVESRGQVRVVPLRVLTIAGAFALSPPTLRALYLLHRERA
jgi:hypothetical protein